MKVIVALALALGLAACTTTKPVIVDQTQFVVIEPPSSMLECPQLKTLPNPETLTNQQVAEVIDKLYRYHKICGINMDKVRKYIDSAKELYK